MECSIIISWRWVSMPDVLNGYITPIATIIGIIAGAITVKSYYDKKLEKLNDKLTNLENKYNELHIHYKKIHDCDIRSSDIMNNVLDLYKKVDELNNSLWELKVTVRQLEIIYEIIGDKYGINPPRKKEDGRTPK